MSQPRRFLMMAAGTGGHVFPALAVAQVLMDKGHDVQWLGTPTGMENALVAKHGITFHSINMKGFRGKSLLNKLMMPLLLLKALLQSLVVIMRTKPHVIVGFGGYIAVPGGVAAKLLFKTLIIHEQNSVAGSANKLLAKIANRVLVAYPNTLPNAQYVGNPVRESIRHLYGYEKNATSLKKNILVMGGSLGALAINQQVPPVFKALSETLDINVWHQTGKNKLEATQALYADYQQHCKIEEFIEDVEAAYQWADIIICRAGALTVSELSVVGLPAVFIPLPHAIDNHQYHNAKWLVDQQAAVLIEQKDLSEAVLLNELSGLLANHNILMAYSKKLKTIAKVDASIEVARICEDYYSGVSHHAA